MRAAGSILAAAVLAAAATSCSWGTFDDLKGNAWVQLAERDDTKTGGDYGVEVTALPPPTEGGIRYVVSVGNPPAGLAQVTINGSGDVKESDGANAEAGGKGRLQPMKDTTPASSLKPYLDKFIAGTPDNADAKIVRYEVGLQNGDTIIGTGSAGLGRTVAVGNLGLGSTAPDIVAVGTLSLTVIPGGDGTKAKTCAMKSPDQSNFPVVKPESLLVTKLSASDDHDIILVGHRTLNGDAPRILVLEGSQVVAAAGGNCPEDNAITTPGPQGPVSIAVGNVDDNPQADVIAGTLGGTADGKVTVYFNVPRTISSQPSSMDIMSTDADRASSARGARLRIADIEGRDGKNEIIVADSGASQNQLSDSGHVQIFRFGACSGAGETRGQFCLLRTLFDPSPARNDQFGRALAIGTFKSSKGEFPILAVAEKAKLFVYFKTDPGTADPRD